MNQPEPTPNQELILKGISKTIQTLRTTITTMNENSLSVTITAEPQVVQIKLPGNIDHPVLLGEKLTNLINKAINENAKKIQSLLKP